MPYEVCYRALLSISVVEGLKPHTSLTRSRRSAARRRAAAIYNPLPRPALAGLDHNVSVFRFHPQDSLAGGPPLGGLSYREILSVEMLLAPQTVTLTDTDGFLHHIPYRQGRYPRCIPHMPQAPYSISRRPELLGSKSNTSMSP